MYTRVYAVHQISHKPIEFQVHTELMHMEAEYGAAELPGMKADELITRASAKSVSISGERCIPKKNESISYDLREREGGRFFRAVGLSGEIGPDASKQNWKTAFLSCAAKNRGNEIEADSDCARTILMERG